MLIFHTPQEMINFSASVKGAIGFVPTMGALHSGHEELLKQAKVNNDIVVLSIFVNPTQFNDKNDLQKYPKTWEADLEIAKKNGVDVIFAPDYDSIYPDNYRYVLSENELSKTLCGKDRPGHFDGVLTIVMKLFNIVSPTNAYFGEKDFQQLSLIENMVEAFFMPLNIIRVKTVRENDGLAKSSRNMRLSQKGRELAPIIFQTINSAKSAEMAAKKLESAGYIIDYVTDYNDRRFVAVKTNDTIDGGTIRLIDNVEI